MKKLAIIGCGISAVPILRKAKEIGVQTFSFAMHELPCTKGLSDYFIPIAYENVETIIDECKRIGINGVIASSDNTTEYTAEIAFRMGLPGNRIKGGFCGKNKYRMRKCLDGNTFVNQPRYYQYHKGININFPAIIKAVDSCGKRGISYVKNNEELNDAVKYSLEASNKQIVLVEEYIDNGTEYSVECLSYQNRHYVIQITKKDSAGPPHFLEIGHHQPGAINNIHTQLIRKAIPEILSSIGIYNSMSHIELKITDDNKLYFIELGARAGGDRIADTLLKLSVDYDYYKGAIQIALDEFEEPVVHHKSYAGIYYLCKQTEYLANLFDKAQGADWCIETKMPKGQFQIAKTNVDRDEHCGYLIYSCDHNISVGKDASWMALRINDYVNACWLIEDFYKRIKRQIDPIELSKGITKFIDKGNIFAVLDEGRIIALLNVYCNQKDSAYINNVEVYTPYRGNGLSKVIMLSAISFCKQLGYHVIQLHVSKGNYIAENLYLGLGFMKTGAFIEKEGSVLNELIINI